MKQCKDAGFFMALIVTVGSTTAYADSYSDILKNLYNSASEPASISDFPQNDLNGFPGPIGPSNNQTCVLVMNNAPTNYPIAVYTRTLPSFGPLLPGSKDQKLMAQSWFSGFDSITSPIVVGSDLVVTNQRYGSIFSPDNGMSTYVAAQLSLRKVDQYISFKMNLIYDANMNIVGQEYYGYCYTNNALF